jgi:diguanylate cyclase (GGDEF)-like protein/PAS domain S-box-containing protein
VSFLRLPDDSALDAATWSARHRLMVVVLAVQAVALALWMAVDGLPAYHVAVDLAPIAATGIVARRERSSQTVRAVAVAIGLFTESAVAVHLSDGIVAVHFHYFVMLCLLAQYEDPLPFAIGIGYVVLQHGIMGSILPAGVYADGIEARHPWMWAVLHGAFVLAASAALMAGWRANALIRVSDRRHRRDAEDYLDIAGAMLLAVDARGEVRMANRRLCTVLGLEEAALVGRPYAEVIAHPDERVLVADTLDRMLNGDQDEFFDIERRMLGGDGSTRLVEWSIAIRRDRAGRGIGVLASGEDVTERRAADARTAREQRDLSGLRRLAQEVASSEDPRRAVVDQVVELAGADFALLMEPADDGRLLAPTASTEPAVLDFVIPMDKVGPSGAREALRTRRPGFHADAEGAPRVNPEMVRRTGARSVAFQPVIVDGRSAAVLVVGWRDRVPAFGSRDRELVAFVADEAAVALQRLATQRRLEDAALKDALTDVPNRRFFDQQLPIEISRARRTGRPLAVATMDLNEFKALNDSAGHDAGDRLLRASAAAWDAELRDTDFLARLGGDEFAILLPDCDRDSALIVADRLRAVIPHGPGCGVGIAVWDGRETAPALMDRADRALYEDKARHAAERLANPTRLAALEATGMLEGATSEELDDVTRVVRWLVGVPVATVSLIDDERQHFVSQCGLTGWAAEEGGTPLSHSFCQHVVTTGRPLVVADARKDPLLAENLAIEELGVIGYAGVPLADGEGNVLGVLCAIDHEPREWQPDELSTLRRLADRAAAELSARADDGQPIAS